MKEENDTFQGDYDSDIRELESLKKQYQQLTTTTLLNK